MTPVGALVHDTTGITVTSPVHGGALILGGFKCTVYTYTYVNMKDFECGRTVKRIGLHLKLSFSRYVFHCTPIALYWFCISLLGGCFS